jgi:hypothetical protein
MDSDHAYNDFAQAQFLSTNLSALSNFNCLSGHDSWQQADVMQA